MGGNSEFGWIGRPFRKITADVKHPDTGEWHHVEGWDLHYFGDMNPNNGVLHIYSGPEPVCDNSGVACTLTKTWVDESMKTMPIHEWFFGMGQWRLAEFGPTY